MITYAQAKTKALKINRKINTALDYGDAFLFSDKNDKSISDSSIIVMKDTGTIVSFHEYLLDRNTNASPVSIPF